MATHYRGERISYLLEEIERLKQVLDDHKDVAEPSQFNELATAYTMLAVNKAKLKALMGEESND